MATWIEGSRKLRNGASTDDLKEVVPVWDQVYLEQFHSRYVDGLDLASWDRILCLEPE